MQAPTLVTVETPPPFDSSYATHLRLSKLELFERTEANTICQTGGAYVGDPIAVPDLSDRFSELEEPIIETFLVSEDGSCAPTGNNDQLIDSTAPLAHRMAAATLEALTGAGVRLSGPGYLTASVSPLSHVANEAHFDDDQFDPDSGVGAVAILADCNGPRIAVEPVSITPGRPGLPLDCADATIAAFGSGSAGIQQADPHRIIVFPQFGQLHAGPTPSSLEGQRPVRTLLVFRMTTVPDR